MHYLSGQWYSTSIPWSQVWEIFVMDFGQYNPISPKRKRMIFSLVSTQHLFGSYFAQLFRQNRICTYSAGFFWLVCYYNGRTADCSFKLSDFCSKIMPIYACSCVYQIILSLSLSLSVGCWMFALEGDWFFTVDTSVCFCWTGSSKMMTKFMKMHQRWILHCSWWLIRFICFLERGTNTPFSRTPFRDISFCFPSFQLFLMPSSDVWFNSK